MGLTLHAFCLPHTFVVSETLSDLEERTISDIVVDERRPKYTETFDVGAPSGSDVHGEFEVDSEATVSDDDVWDSGSDNPAATVSWWAKEVETK